MQMDDPVFTFEGGGTERGRPTVERVASKNLSNFCVTRVWPTQKRLGASVRVRGSHVVCAVACVRSWWRRGGNVLVDEWSAAQS